jgi:hypothetical protein
MRKWIVLTAVFLCLAIAGPAQALQISMTNSNPQYWGNLTVDFDGRDNWVVGAGRFYTTVYDGGKKIDTFSYCVDLGKYFSWNEVYTAEVIQPTGAFLNAAWLVSRFDPFVGTYWSESLEYEKAKTVAMTLQLAIWKTLYDGKFVPESGGDMELFDDMIAGADNIGSFDGSGFFVADISGQDQLVAAPVPEPATMLLMGIGLLGLGVVGRKRIK